MSNVAFTGRRVLVVEDEVLIGMVLEDILDMLGCTVVGWLLALVVLRNYRARVTYWI